MKPDSAILARTFLEATGATCLDAETVARGLSAVFAEQRRRDALPSTPNEILIRRIAQVTARICDEHAVTEARLRNVADKSPHLVAARRYWVVALVAAGLSEVRAAREAGVSRVWVWKAKARVSKPGARWVSHG